MWMKVFVDNLKFLIPFKYKLRKMLRRSSPYQSQAVNDDYAFEQGLHILSSIRGYSGKINTVLEFGTGWVPTIPMMFVAAGAKNAFVKRVLLFELSSN